MPKKGRSILKYNHREKSIKVLFIIYITSSSELEKYTEKSLTTKGNKHTTCGYSLFTNCLFKTTKKI